MARIETDPNYSSPTFSRATASTDLFKKEDVQNLAAAMSAHDHTTGKGLPMAAGSIPNGTITSAMIADATIDTADLKDGAVTSAKILDGTIATGDLANSAVTNAKLGTDTARANLLTNGGFEIWQRGNGPFTATGVFAADRWSINLQAGDTISVSRDTTNKDGASSAAAAVTYTRSTGGTWLRQTMNDVAPGLVGATITLSVRVWTATANAVRLAIWNGTARTNGAYHPGNSTWQTISLTATMPASSSQLFLEVQFDQSCTAYVDNAMLVVGSVAADYAPLHPADDLARCVRYYEQIGGMVTSEPLTVGQAFSTTQAVYALRFRSQKAVTPTITNFGSFATMLANSTNQALTNISYAAISVAGLQITTTVASGLVAGNATLLNAGAVVVEANP